MDTGPEADTRDGFLAWVKERALAYARQGDKTAALASFMSDIGKWKGGSLYDQATLQTMFQDAMFFRNTTDDMVRWVEGWN